jgi:putative heme-binding domain-containing protein
MGPDGAIYVADWYNPIIQHGEVDFRDERRDKVHGRIWRVSAKGRPALETRLPVETSTADLLAKLREPEEWVRQNAKQMLKERGPSAVAGPLAQWLAGLDKSAADYDACRLEALWMYEGLDLVSMPLVESLLKSADHRVRAAAVRVVTHWFDRLPSAVTHLKSAIGDEHPQVRLEAVRGLSLVKTPAAAGWACTVLDRRMDRFLDFALWQTMRDLAPIWLPAVREGRFDFDGRLDHLTFALKAADAPGVVGPLLQLVQQGKVPAERLEGILSLAGGLGNSDELAAVLNLLLSPEAKLSAEQKQKVLQAVIDGSRLRKIKPAGDLTRLGTLLDDGHESLRATAARGVGAWKIEGLRPKLATQIQQPAATAAQVSGAIEGLASLGGPASVQALSQLGQSAADVEVRMLAVEAVATLDVKLAAKLAIEIIPKLTAEHDPTTLINLLVSQKGGPVALAEVLAKTELTADTAKIVLRGVRSSSQPAPELIAAVQKAGNLENAGWKSTPELVKELTAAVTTQGNPARGEQVFRRKENQCFKCHSIGGAGGLVGPDLVSIGATAQIDYLIESLLVPAAKVKEGFHSVLISTDEGRVITGIPVRDTNTELVLRDAEDRLITIGKNAIESRKDGRSLMPDGTVDVLTRNDLIDLVRFLSELGKIGDYSLSKTRTARRYQVLPWNKEAHQRLNRSSHDVAASDEPVFVWEAAYTQVNGSLPLAGLPEYKIHQTQPAVTFLRCELEASTAGKVRLVANVAEGLSLWVNGKPTPVTSETTLDLPTGRTRLTLAVNRQLRTDALRLELADVAGSAAQVQFVGGK